jgi:hypothetical protein
MTWAGDPKVLKAILREVGADFRWADGETYIELGISDPDSLLIPVVPIMGGRYVQVIDGATYYVRGAAHDLSELLRDVPQGEDARDITDVLVPDVEPAVVTRTDP